MSQSSASLIKVCHSLQQNAIDTQHYSCRWTKFWTTCCKLFETEKVVNKYSAVSYFVQSQKDVPLHSVTRFWASPLLVSCLSPNMSVSLLAPVHLLYMHCVSFVAMVWTTRHYKLYTKLTYAASVWGFRSADDRRRIEAVLRRGIRAGFYQSEWPTVAQLIQNNDDTLFHRVLSCSKHVLHCLQPDKCSHVYQLRSRPHDCTLTANDDTRNFIHRLLHCDIYWFVTILSFLTHCLRCVMSSFFY